RASNAVAPSDGHSLRIEPGGHPVVEVRPVHVVLDIFLPAVNEFDGAIDALGDLDRANYAVDFEPSPESAADKVVVHRHLLDGQAEHLRRCGLRARHCLCANPKFAALLANMDGAVHWLQ